MHYFLQGFTIRTVRTQNNHVTKVSNSLLSCKLFSLHDSFLAQLTRTFINFCIRQQAKLMLIRVNG